MLTSAHIHKNVLQETGFFLHNIHSEYNFHKEKAILESNDSVLISLFTAKKKKRNQLSIQVFLNVNAYGSTMTLVERRNDL